MLKVLSLFSGIGAFEKALENLEVPYELTAFCEFDKYAVKSYCGIHGVDESKNLGDITKVDEKTLPKDIDILTYGFPCQDISLAGKQKGLFNEDGSQTRSGLFFEALRIIEATQPKVAIAENVKNLVGKKFNAQFQVVLASLESAGYNCYWKVLNSKDYGIPQNRERVFIVSIRKDLDHGLFEFPKAFPLEKRLKDVLEDEVDESFYLKETLDWFIRNSFAQEEKGNGFRFDPHVRGNADIAKTITTRSGSRMDDNYIIEIDSDQPTFKFDSTNRLIQVGQMYPNSGNPQAGRIYDAEGIAPTMDSCSGGNRMPKVVVREPKIEVVGNYSPSGHDASRIVHPDGIAPTVKENHGTVTAVVEKFVYDEQNRYFRKDGCVGTIMTDGSSPKKNSRIVEVVGVWDGFNQRVRADGSCVGTLTQNCGADLKRNGQGIIELADGVQLRVRKLTPKECFRLMGFDDEAFAKAEAVNSNTQLYKQAGNSIVVDVLEELFCMMLDEDGKIFV